MYSYVGMLAKILSSLTVVSLCLLLVVLTQTNPTQAGPFGILAVFITAYMSLIGVATFFLYFGSRLVAYISRAVMTRKPLPQLSLRHAYYYSTVVALAPIMLVGLQSVGGVTLYELLLVGLFVAIGVLYVAKRT